MRPASDHTNQVRRLDSELLHQILARSNPGRIHELDRYAFERRGLGKWPFLRGIASLVESLKLGSEALRFDTG